MRVFSLLAVIAGSATLLAAGGVALIDPASAPGRGSACAERHTKPSSLSRKAVARTVRCLLNRKRKARGLRALKRHSKPRKAATRHNRRMIRTNCFAHQCPGELDLVGRLTKARYLPHSGRWGVGENLAWGMGRRSTPGSIVRKWMRSPGHRANILTESFRHVGIAVHRGNPRKDSKRGTTYTVDFGFRR